jgi:spore coat protein A
MLTRRQFLKVGSIIGASAMMPQIMREAPALQASARHASAMRMRAVASSPTLSKFAQNLRGVGPGGIPVAIPDGARQYGRFVTADHYTIDIDEFTDTLHPDLSPTTLWGYNPESALGESGVPAPKHLGGIVIAQRGRPTQITFHNKLPNHHILPVDTSIMGAEGAPNRTAVHLHGGYVPWVTDGGPFAWWDPQGGKGASFLNNQVLRPGEIVPNDEAEYFYPNQQSARMLWYHDHALGTTRLNAYAGLATAYIIRDLFEEKVLVKLLGLPDFIENGGRELPIVFQEKFFNDDGGLGYPSEYDAEVGDDATLPLPIPSIVPEFFGDTMLVNGTVWPKADVEPRRYRLRILNATQARFFNLQLYEDNGSGQPDFTKPGPDFLVIGTEGGFLARPVVVKSNQQFSLPNPEDFSTLQVSLLTGPAERWDLIVDFNGLGGKKYILYNDAPAPFPMGDVPDENTQLIMRFDVKPNSAAIKKDRLLLIRPNTLLAGNPLSLIDKPLAGPNPQTPALLLSWAKTPTAPLPIPTRKGVTVRQLTLNEAFDQYGRLIQKLGTNVAVADGEFGRAYADPTTESASRGSVEVWQIANTTGDTHPMHFHLVNVQILSRRPFDVDAYLNTPANTAATPTYIGPARGPDATELGWKETVKMHPGEITTVIMSFDLPPVPFNVPASPRTGGNEYVWHCHILEHEEHDMMRPLVVQGSNPVIPR